MRECVSEAATPRFFSLSLSLTLSHSSLLFTVPQPPLPYGKAELISADAVVTEAGCEIRTPGEAAQQGCQFS